MALLDVDKLKQAVTDCSRVFQILRRQDVTNTVSRSSFQKMSRNDADITVVVLKRNLIFVSRNAY